MFDLLGLILPSTPHASIGIAAIAALLSCLAVLLCLFLDHLFGEPPSWLHPVVAMGRYLHFWGERLAPTQALEGGAARKVFRAAAWAWCAGAVLVWAVVAALWLGFGWGLAAGMHYAVVQRSEWALGMGLLLSVLVLGLCLKPMLSWRLLQDEVGAVEAALQNSLEAGRARLAHLVSRDVQSLTPLQVRESALESLAENLNDSVIAPLFWFSLAGLPAAALYRFANTADAMWGYPGWRNGRHWAYAGKWAAHADDCLSWLPARLSALCILWLGRQGSISALRCNWPILRREAARTLSPNSGWPMAALALVLNVRLTKPGVYVLNPTGRQATAGDSARALALCQRVVWWPVWIGTGLAACVSLLVFGRSVIGG